MSIVYPNGTAEVTVAAAESIAVYSDAECQVFRKLGFPNYPESLDLIGTVNAGQTTFGAYASGATIVLKAGPAGAEYTTGSAPNTPAQLTMRAAITSTQIAALTTVTVPSLTTTDLPSLSTTQLGQFNTLLISANTAVDVLNGVTATS